MNHPIHMKIDNYRCCRLCFESEEYISELISPCKCKGSSLLIHRHCLERWQQISFENHTPFKAITCQICNSRYIYPSLPVLMYQIMLYIMSLYLSTIMKYFKKTIFTVAIEPLKLIIHAILVLVTLPWGQFSLGDITLSWIGNEFPPQLALVCSGDPIPNMSEGLILVASPSIPKSSIFHQAVILLLEYSVDHGSRGVLLNSEIGMNFPLGSNILSTDQNVGYGGPLDKNNITVIHDYRDLSNESDFSCLSESIFVTEYDTARRTLSQLSSKARTLIKLYRVAAQKARLKFQECRSVATAYANRAKDSISASFKSAFSSTQRAVSRVSRGNTHLIPLLRNRFDVSSLTSPSSSSSSSSSSRQQSQPQQLNQSQQPLITVDTQSIGIYCENCGVRTSMNNRTPLLTRSFIRLGSSSYCSICHQLQPNKPQSPLPSPSPLSSPSLVIGTTNDSDDNQGDEEYESSSMNKTNIRVLRGYSRWGANQLDGEIRKGLWKVLPLRHEYVFPERRDTNWWERLIHEEEDKLNIVSFAQKTQNTIEIINKISSESSSIETVSFDPIIRSEYDMQVETNININTNTNTDDSDHNNNDNQNSIRFNSVNFFEEFTLSLNDIITAISN